jgi:hypothetical protein
MPVGGRGRGVVVPIVVVVVTIVTTGERLLQFSSPARVAFLSCIGETIAIAIEYAAGLYVVYC